MYKRHNEDDLLYVLKTIMGENYESVSMTDRCKRELAIRAIAKAEGTGAPIFSYAEVIETLITMGAPVDLVDAVTSELDDIRAKNWHHFMEAAKQLGLHDVDGVATMLRRVY